MILDGVKINYGIFDNTISEDTIDISSHTASQFCDEADSLSNAPKTKLAYLEKNYLWLDGSFVFPETNKKYNVGWENNAISDASGNIDCYVDYIFGLTHDSYGINIVFGKESIATDFDIIYYDEENNILETKVVTDNASQNFLEFFSVFGWKKIRINISKISKPYQRARFDYVVFGYNSEFTEENIISISASRNIDLTADYSDNGELSVSIFNDGIFNEKELKELYLTIQNSMVAHAYIKKQGSDEYELFSSYNLDNITSKEDGQIVEFSGFDLLYKLNSNVYTKGIVYPNGISLKDLAEEIALEVGIEISVDDSLEDIITKGYIPEVSYREAFRLIAEAGCCYIEVRKDGNGIDIKKYAEIEKPDLTDDDIVDESISSENKDRYLGIVVKKYIFGASKDSIELGHIEDVLITSETQYIDIVYATYPADIDSIQVFSETGTITFDAYSDHVVVGLSGTEGEITWITVTGKPYTYATIDVSQGLTPEQGISPSNIKIIDNKLITGDIAENVALYQYNNVVNKNIYKLNVITVNDFVIGDKTKLEDNDVVIEKESFSIDIDNYENILECREKNG